MTFEFTRMPWKDVVTMAADVAKNGFNVTHDLGKYSVMWYKSLGEVSVTSDTARAIKKTPALSHGLISVVPEQHKVNSYLKIRRDLICLSSLSLPS